MENEISGLASKFTEILTQAVTEGTVQLTGRIFDDAWTAIKALLSIGSRKETLDQYLENPRKKQKAMVKEIESLIADNPSLREAVREALTNTSSSPEDPSISISTGKIRTRSGPVNVAGTVKGGIHQKGYND